jgi:hypothetical protein
MNELLGIALGSEAVETIVGYLGDAEMRFARIARTLRHLLLGQHYEQGSLAYLWQAYDAGFHDLAFSLSLFATRSSQRFFAGSAPGL